MGIVFKTSGLHFYKLRLVSTSFFYIKKTDHLLTQLFICCTDDSTGEPHVRPSCRNAATATYIKLPIERMKRTLQLYCTKAEKDVLGHVVVGHGVS